MATVNQPIQLKFNASDDGTFVYQVLDQPGSGFSFNGSSGVATWTPADTNVVNIRLLCAVFFKLIPGISESLFSLHKVFFFTTNFWHCISLKKKFSAWRLLITKTFPLRRWMSLSFYAVVVTIMETAITIVQEAPQVACLTWPVVCATLDTMVIWTIKKTCYHCNNKKPHSMKQKVGEWHVIFFRWWLWEWRKRLYSKPLPSG